MNAPQGNKKYNSKKYVPQKQSNKVSYILGGVIVAVIVALAVGLLVLSNDKSEVTPADTSELAASATLVVGQADAPVTIDLFEDAICPYCGKLEVDHGEEIAAKINDGSLRVRYHMLHFLDKASTSGDYSSRVAGAVLTLNKAGDEKASLAFHTAIMAEHQPEEGSDLSTEDIVAIAREAGASDAALAEITSGANIAAAQALAATSTDLLEQAVGQAVTPSVLQDGKETTIEAVLDGSGDA